MYAYVYQRLKKHINKEVNFKNLTIFGLSNPKDSLLTFLLWNYLMHLHQRLLLRAQNSQPKKAPGQKFKESRQNELTW